MKDNIVTVKHLSFTYKDSKVPAVNDISFSIPRGSWTTLVGHNGSGKSTLPVYWMAFFYPMIILGR